MLNRLNKIIKNDEYLTKEELYDYVFYNIKPPNSTKNRLDEKIFYESIEKENSNEEKKVQNYFRESSRIDFYKKENRFETYNKAKKEKKTNLNENSNKKSSSKY